MSVFMTTFSTFLVQVLPGSTPQPSNNFWRSIAWNLGLLPSGTSLKSEITSGKRLTNVSLLVDRGGRQGVTHTYPFAPGQCATTMASNNPLGFV